MAVQITLNQSGKSAGIAGQAREDLATGTPVLCSTSGGPFLHYRWAVVSKPIDILTPVRSAAVFSTSTSSTSLLQPIDLPGTYLLRVTVDSGNGLGADAGDVAEIDFYAGPALAADPRRLPRRWPAAFEQLSHNVPDAIDPAGNTEGWSREQLKWREIYLNSMAWAGGFVVNNDGDMAASLVRGFGCSVVWVSTGIVQVTFDTPMPDAFYAIQHGVDAYPNGDTGIIGFSQPVAKLDTGFQIQTFLFFPGVEAPFLADGFPFSFRVTMGLAP